MAVLSEKAIWARLTSQDDDQLILTPLLEEGQVGASSADVRLGHQFIVLQRSAVSSIDPTELNLLERRIHQTQRRIYVSTNEPFVIHPGQLVLAATLEYVSMPHDLTATVEGRSSWGRLGLIIATACNVAPGFKGCITLELVNDGEVPLVLYPGIRVAQLVFHKTEKEADYLKGTSDEMGAIVLSERAAKYDCPTGPQFSRVHFDREMAIWGKADS